jgi:hypothetical protein
MIGQSAAGVVNGEGFAVDASVIEADAGRFQRFEGATIEWSDAQLVRRAVPEYVVPLSSANPTIDPERPPKALSRTDPAAAWSTRGRHKVMVACSLTRLHQLANPRLEWWTLAQTPV